MSPNVGLAMVARLIATAVRNEVVKLSMFDDQFQVIAESERWTLIVNEVTDSAAAEELETNGDLDE